MQRAADDTRRHGPAPSTLGPGPRQWGAIAEAALPTSSAELARDHCALTWPGATCCMGSAYVERGAEEKLVTSWLAREMFTEWGSASPSGPVGSSRPREGRKTVRSGGGSLTRPGSPDRPPGAAGVCQTRIATRCSEQRTGEWHLRNVFASSECRSRRQTCATPTQAPTIKSPPTVSFLVWRGWST